MIELLILNHLKMKLDAPVYLEEPERAPADFVLFEKTGSGTENRIHSATFAFQSYAGSLYGAAALNEAVKLAVESLAELPDVGRVKLNSDYNFMDVATKRHRYQAVYDITY